MRALSMLLLMLMLGCRTTPDMDANAGKPAAATGSQAFSDTGAEFDDAGSGAGDGLVQSSGSASLSVA